MTAEHDTTMTVDRGDESITSVLTETRVFPPPAEFAEGPHFKPGAVPGALGPGQGRPRGVLGRAGEGARLVQALGQGARLERRRSRSGSSAARSTPRTTASTATARARPRTRPRSSGRASRATAACSATRTCTARSAKFANVLKGLGVKKGDVVAIYMPMIPELAIAMLACARIGAPAHGRLRRLQRRGPGRPDPRLQGQGAGHGRRRLAPRQGRPAQGERRRRRGRSARRSSTSWSTAGPARRSPWTPGRDHWWHELVAERLGRLPGRAARQRAPAVHPLHLRLDRQAQGHPPHHRRLPPRHRASTTKWVFDLKDDDTYWCTADIGWVTGPLVHRLRPARQRRDRRDVRGGPELARRGAVLEDHRGLPGHRSSTPPRPPSARS